MNLKPQATTSSRRSKDRTAQTSWGSSVKPTVTRLSPAVRQDYVTNKQAQPLQAALTYSGMLHQSRTLETLPADKVQDHSETGESRRSPKVNGKLVSNFVEVREAAPAAMNATRNNLVGSLVKLGLPVITATGGMTKFKRFRLNLPKAHWLDAACVGNTPTLRGTNSVPLTVRAMGHGSRKRTRLDKYGFPRGYLSPAKRAFGFQTGDMAVAIVPTGKYAGRHVGRVAIRHSGSFNLQTPNGIIRTNHKHCRLLQRADGYNYQTGLHPRLNAPRVPAGVAALIEY